MGGGAVEDLEAAIEEVLAEEEEEDEPEGGIWGSWYY